MMEKQPQMRLSRQACLSAAISGPSSEHMIAGFMSIDRPCREYSGKTTRFIVPMLRRALPTVATIFCVCAARSACVTTTGNCNCTTPTTTPFGDLLRPPSPFIAPPLVPRSASCLFRHRQFAGHVTRRVLGARGCDHDDEREDVGGGVEEVVALGDPDRLQRRAKRAGRAEKERRGDAAKRVPAGEDDKRYRHQALARGEALVPRARIGERQERAADAREKPADRCRQESNEVDGDTHGARGCRAVAHCPHDQSPARVPKRPDYQEREYDADEEERIDLQGAFQARAVAPEAERDRA